MHTSTRTPPLLKLIVVGAGTAAILAGAMGINWHHQTARTNPNAQRMLIAPMIGVIEPCIEQPPSSSPVPTSLAKHCSGVQGSAAALVESTLQGLNKKTPGKFELGYTLPVPLLKLFVSRNGDWEIDQGMVQRLVTTIRDTQRPVILYLFSTHFAVDAAIEEELSQDTKNMAHTQDGPLGRDSYYDSHVYNWSLASTENSLTARRLQALHAVANAICLLKPEEKSRIRGVTLLGEIHHLFPNFQGGMGYESPYRITDYSSASVRGFQRHLEDRFSSIDRLNYMIGGNFKSFSEIQPPSKNIRQTPLKQYIEHIDAFSHGKIPLSGWAFVQTPQSNFKPKVLVHLNGQLIGKATVKLNRQDVLSARPEFGYANTGWRYDLEYHRLPIGIHRLDFLLEDKPGHTVFMGTRNIAVMDRHQNTPRQAPSLPTPRAHSRFTKNIFHIDQPHDQAAYYYNPLSVLWHNFRSQQITKYLHYIDSQLTNNCLADVPRYTHQIVPFFNPSWDATRFSIEDSLRPQSEIRLGVSLYGEAAYGESFHSWLDRHGVQRYGITEFHPLKPMSTDELRVILEKHADKGAQFLSFFLEPEWEGQRLPRGHNIFSFDPLNKQFGSDVLYRSTQKTLEH